ncbi:hypothetical protein SGRA_1890 [Saprospira grandis str. Lewin]|uniref:Uncharacterized protein n=1 Tax=Saprospira grandis (strain Lewin) TaxID=984262 RepID=H6L1I0_SAPGL|nr:hypothetical protein SGRA_1890 [Saprospira grandis str. Lewin]
MLRFCNHGDRRGRSLFGPQGLFVEPAQRCGGVAAGQTEPLKAAKGRADLRAPQHSGGRPWAAAGPKKKPTYKKDTYK